MKMYFKCGVFLSCWLLTLARGDPPVDSIKCDNRAENCEQFSFRRAEQNVSNVNNNSSRAKILESDDFKTLGLAENRIVSEQADNQENGNFDINTLFWK